MFFDILKFIYIGGLVIKFKLLFKILVIIILTSCVHQVNSSKNIYNLENLKSDLNQIISKENLSAISLAIKCPKVNDFNVIDINLGFNSINGENVTQLSLFQIGSITKTFVATIILQLENEKLLSLEDNIEKYFPQQYKNWSKIKIKNLLNMTSGIHNYNDPKNQYFIGKTLRDPDYYFTNEDLLRLVKSEDLKFVPNSSWMYSNTNYILLGKIIEKVSNSTFSEQLQKRILQPLQMSNTYFIKHRPKTEIPLYKISHLTQGYLYNETLLKNFDINDLSLSFASYAGSIISTSNDLLKFINALFLTKENNNLNSLKKLSAEFNYFENTDNTGIIRKISSNKMDSGYGLGIFILNDNNFNDFNYFHTGGTYGYLSKMSYLKNSNASYVLLINSTHQLDFRGCPT
ncbi:MAG: class A beta-lactamase-related serine hydrolase [Spirobacillus cienkowskii]|jgi:D-alanyl-D-alanine carboxypeptidase|uniref:Class A beta-lactamase-related serine hydrolase n=1 Tax=Spirobacillus cienkowskii TaxID=495820 RepID=A0A369KTP3_9BACT|nr:MAG: class A beta-lactamase-related serine hydrolase [Spirobacillus cienkowskii]